MLRRAAFTSCEGGVPHGLVRASTAASSVLLSRRFAGVDLLSPLSKLGQSRDLAADLKAGRSRNNKEVVASFEKIQTFDEIHYRKVKRPWELVPRYAKKRVTDLVGILSSEDRMEIEQAIDKMQSLCKTDLYVVIVPTVGYTTPKAFANSIFFDWAIGEPDGNGLLLVITQREATVQLVTSPAIEEYFDLHFLDPAVRDTFQPLVREGKPSYATVQLVYAVARQAQEMHGKWEKGLLPMPARNAVRKVGKTMRFGLYQVPYLLFGSLMFIALTAWLISQLMDMMCPKCHKTMNRIRDDATLQEVMTHGQYLEQINGCAHYRVFRCPHCHEEGNTRVILSSRDMHQSTRCLQCVDCQYYTCVLEKEVLKLPTKSEDGIKRLTYECANCHIGREVLLPLFRPVDQKAEGTWYDTLIAAGASAKTGNANNKLKL